MDYFNKQPKIAALSTANSDGKVDVAIFFGSPRMIDERTIVVALGENRTFEYLQENPNAVNRYSGAGRGRDTWRAGRDFGSTWR